MESESKTNFHHSNEEESQHQSSSSEGQRTERTSPKHLLREMSTNSIIFKVPEKLFKEKEEAYTPSNVSIGPFHASAGIRSYLQEALMAKGEDQEEPGWLVQVFNKAVTFLRQSPGKNCDHLRVREEDKCQYVLHFLRKTEDLEKTLKEFQDKIGCQEKIVHQSYKYAEKISFSEDELVEMMIVDGCFILQLFIRSWFMKKNPNQDDFIPWIENYHYDKGDPIFDNPWMARTLRQDLCLLENQIPFFVLQDLYDIFKTNTSKRCHRKFPSITQLALAYFLPDLKLNQTWILNLEPSIEVCIHTHLLDLLQKTYLTVFFRADSIPARSKGTLGFKESAAKLLDAGIEFQEGSQGLFFDKVSEEKCLKKHSVGIVFRKGVIKIPPLCINETTESLLRNLIAFEQYCSPENRRHVFSSYAILMTSLVHSPEDMTLLVERKIITHNSGRNTEVEFFDSISTGVDHDQVAFCFGELCD